MQPTVIYITIAGVHDKNFDVMPIDPFPDTKVAGVPKVFTETLTSGASDVAWNYVSRKDKKD